MTAAGPAAGLALLCAALAGAPAVAAEAEAEGRASLLAVPHPGRAVARRLVQEGTGQLGEGRIESAMAALDAAVASDPLLVPAWVNLSAAAIRACRPGTARLAALVGRLLAPESEGAATNLKLALQLDCPDEGEAEVAAAPLIAAFERRTDPRFWTSLAEERRSRGQPLLAALFEEFAIERGAGKEARLRESGDLEHAGLLRPALAALEGLTEEAAERRERLLQRIGELEPAARAAARELAEAAGLDEEAAEAAEEVALALLASGTDATALRARLFDLYEVGRPRVISGTWGELTAGREWVITEQGGASGPLVELTRFPGDTRLWLFGWRDPDPARLAEPLGPYTGEPPAALSPCAKARVALCRTGQVSLDLGRARPIEARVWLLGDRAEGAPVLAAIAIVGDGGCGEPCAARAAASAEGLVASLRPSRQPPLSPAPWPLATPPAWRDGGHRHDEASEPWSGYGLANGLRVDLPPGLVVTVVRPEFKDRNVGPRTALWLRGRFVDLDGKIVTIGDEEFAGLVELPAGGAAGLAQARETPAVLAPRRDPSARLLGSAKLDGVLKRAETGEGGVVARFAGARFHGEWLVMRVLSGGRLADVVLPVASSPESLSLLYIPLTVRPVDKPGPPPPVDLSDRFRISFLRIEHGRASTDPRAGLLLARDLEIAVPRGFAITLAARSAEGFPIRFRDAAHPGADGRIEIWRGARSVETLERRVEAIEKGPPAGGWRETRHSRGGRSFLAFYGSEGESRCHVLLVPDDPSRHDPFHVSLARGHTMDAARWRAACELLASSARYRRPRH